MRVDKLTLAALEATLMLYREPERAMREIPILGQLSASLDELRARASHIGTALPLQADVAIVDSTATVGGGAFPTARIPSIALRFGANAAELERKLRLGHPAVIGRISGDRLHIDLRTILPLEDDELTAAIQTALA
jgi:L-seryl-tRNA(Ser) seleniumtransferase